MKEAPKTENHPSPVDRAYKDWQHQLKEVDKACTSLQARRRKGQADKAKAALDKALEEEGITLSQYRGGSK